MLERAGSLAGTATCMSKDIIYAFWGTEHYRECDISEKRAFKRQQKEQNGVRRKSKVRIVARERLRRQYTFLIKLLSCLQCQV